MASIKQIDPRITFTNENINYNGSPSIISRAEIKLDHTNPFDNKIVEAMLEAIKPISGEPSYTNYYHSYIMNLYERGKLGVGSFHGLKDRADFNGVLRAFADVVKKAVEQSQQAPKTTAQPQAQPQAAQPQRPASPFASSKKTIKMAGIKIVKEAAVGETPEQAAERIKNTGSMAFSIANDIAWAADGDRETLSTLKKYWPTWTTVEFMRCKEILEGMGIWNRYNL